ncbi:hypothetical protein ABH944_002509 [Caballeronia udeis]|uniref:Uncharacterized protein n=1 Tax=Caballeronia udeis TaxID=1232866 RepID=A0A158G9K6_9BURK|nr:hypothetical protein [Caballeronia udeis]SAL28712.1 hypothetical protein AWB69_02243 [Caballeronia udeis]
MKTRSALEICLPLALFIAACALSLPTLMIAVAWMTIGVMSLGHRTLESFPIDGISRKWLRGYRGACLLFYHLAWWPWYMRTPLRDGADRIGRRLFTRKKSPHRESENPQDNLPTGEREENSKSDAGQGRRD